MRIDSVRDSARFLDPLVGTAQATDSFRDRLVQFVSSPAEDMPTSSDPYSRLIVGLEAEVDSFTRAQSRGADPEAWRHFGTVIKFGGVEVAVEALRAEGALYERHARVPQDPANVQRSTKRVLSHVLSLAMMDSAAAADNLNANRLGLNPRSRVLKPVLAIAKKKAVTNVVGFGLARTFRAQQDAEGQVHIQLRHRNRGRETERRCPATQVKTEIAPGQFELSLWRYLQVIGDVAMTEIFPRQFDIIQPDQN